MDPGTSTSPSNHDRSQSVSKPRRRRNNEAKRARGEISCAECRRLKMKCDKQIPCGTCTRRGCANICPLETSRKSPSTRRLILADTQALHRKITQMSERIRQLEDALAIMQADISNERHPLLRRELMRIKHWPEVEEKDPPEPEYKQENTVEDVISTFGTLTIGEDGGAKYFGHSAGSESLLHLDEPVEIPCVLSPIPYCGTLGSLGPLARDNPAAFASLEADLPPQPRAWALIEAYFAHGTFSFRPVQRDDLVNDIMSPIYKAIKVSSDPGSVARDVPHKLGLLFIVFALGALADLTNPPFSEEAHKYFLMGKSALSARSVTESPALETVQALALAGAYHGASGRRMTAETSWEFFGLALKLAQSVNRDCARWNLDAKTIRRRRYIFWELYTVDTFLSLHLGRPPTISLAYVDCEFPSDEEQTLSEDEKVVPGFWAWKYSVAKDIVGPISECLTAVRTPSYDKILDFDRLVRQKGMPKHYNFLVEPDNEEYRDPSRCLHTWLVAQYRLLPMLYVHRPYFAQALLDNSGNPLCSPYAPSFLATYRGASLMIKRDLHYFERCSDLFLRLPAFWSHSFAAAVIMGLVVVRTPKSTMCLNALAELNEIVDLFEKGAKVNIRAQRAITFLRKLRSRAQQAYFKSRNGSSSSSADGAEELALFGGQTKLVQSKFLSKYWMHSGRQSDGASSASSPTNSSATFNDISMAVHPSLVDYLSSLPTEDANSASSFSFGEDAISMDWTQTAFQAHFLQFVPQVMTPSSQYRLQSATFYPASAPVSSNGPSMPCPMIDDFSGLYHGFVPQGDGFGNGQPSSDLGMDPQFMSLMQSSGLFDDLGNAGL
ncbi:hypothetical protein NEOLEDRAFT_1103262 [Neolentinus lepideus HHB14362 ss-1]|uniref:Zn(2)-C6 fungal-type domain-containing protein n=1 Tax=Neolentinus lepideus HHB14362 ss-1 TaxID=1314782 RepID=A0A165MR95_9AGAM|nr:hypothetical protein NEOLEDRAFT_1103262 [Neolentinus lepideus HHB14362 ss-1]